MILNSLKRVRWAVRATLWLGLVASTVGNVLHAEPNPVAQAIAAWPVAALYLTIELISRVPIHRRWLAGVRWCAAGVIAGIAAWVSYHHMAGVAARYGETGASPYLLPLSVDGLIVVASICLVELGGRIRAAEVINEGSTDELGTGGERDAGSDVRPDHQEPAGQRAEGAVVAAEGAEGEGREVVAAPAQIEPPTPPARKPHTTNPERVRRAYARDPSADPNEVARRLKLSPATVKRYRPVAPQKVNGNVPDLELEGMQ